MQSECLTSAAPVQTECSQEFGALTAEYPQTSTTPLTQAQVDTQLAAIPAGLPTKG